MNEGFLFELFLPDQPRFSGSVQLVSLPGSEGILTVMAKHTPLITQLVPGFINFTTIEGEELSYITFGGVANISTDKCVVLVEEALLVSEFDLKALESRIELAKKELEQGGGSDEYRSAIENFLHQLTTIGGMLSAI